MELAAERCVACHKDAPRVEPDEQAVLLQTIPEWNLVEVKSVPRLKRTIKVTGWQPAVALANQIADAAEVEDHHPAILIEWGKVTVSWWTHAIRGLHRNDFVMAARTDKIVDAL